MKYVDVTLHGDGSFTICMDAAECENLFDSFSLPKTNGLAVIEGFAPKYGINSVDAGKPKKVSFSWHDVIVIEATEMGVSEDE